MTVGPRLVLVGTPIGNLGDISERAAQAFRDADVVACEDTRRTGKLLAHLGIRAPELLRIDEHTEYSTAPTLVERMSVEALVVAYASDAGMPGISDPGSILVRAAVDSGVPVEVAPGPFAGAVALVGSGLLDSGGRFVFEGFLPRKGTERARRLEALATEYRTTVLYEAPHRLERTLGDLMVALGPQRRVALCRELTKLHEETFRGSLAEAAEHCEGVAPRGEYVVVIEGAEPPTEATDDELLEALGVELGEGSTRRDAAVAVAARFGVGVNRVKRLLAR